MSLLCHHGVAVNVHGGMSARCDECIVHGVMSARCDKCIVHGVMSALCMVG